MMRPAHDDLVVYPLGELNTPMDSDKINDNNPANTASNGDILRALEEMKGLMQSQKATKKGVNVRLLDALDEWTRQKEPIIKPNSRNKYRIFINNHIKPYFSTLEHRNASPFMLAQLDRTGVKSFIADLQSKGLAPATSGDILRSVFIPFLKEMMSDDRLDTFSLDKLGIKKRVPVKQKDSLTASEVVKLCETARHHTSYVRYYAPILLLLYTGIRRGELLGLTWDDVDFDNGLIRIHQTNVATANEPTTIKETTKTEAGTRTIGINTGVVKALRWHRDTIQKKKRTYICGELRADRPTDPNNFARAIREILKLAGLDGRGFSTHTFRHTFITESIKVGMSDIPLMDCVGHKDARMINHYRDKAKQVEYATNEMKLAQNKMQDGIFNSVVLLG